MPWPAKQARAIAISYRARRKRIPGEVGAALSASLTGKAMPKKRVRPPRG